MKRHLAILTMSLGLALPLAGLLAAPAQARSFCDRFPDDPACYQDNADDGGYNDGYGNDGYGDDSYDDNGWQDNSKFGHRRPPLRRQPEFASCNYVARWLAYESGYRNVRAQDCSGQNYKFVAWRGRHSYSIKVDAKRLRILYEIRLQ